MRPDPPINLSKRRSEMSAPSSLSPCPASTTGTLGFAEPTRVPCGLARGHDGAHRYEIWWTDEPAY